MKKTISDHFFPPLLYQNLQTNDKDPRLHCTCKPVEVRTRISMCWLEKMTTGCLCFQQFHNAKHNTGDDDEFWGKTTNVLLRMQQECLDYFAKDTGADQ